MKSSNIDNYIVKSFQRGYLEFDEKGNLKITETGKKELNDIAKVCVDKISAVIPQLKTELEVAARSLGDVLGTDLTAESVFKYTYKTMLGTDARVLAFLVHEKDSGYKYLSETLGDEAVVRKVEQSYGKNPGPNEPKGGNVTSLLGRKGKKYDA